VARDGADAPGSRLGHRLPWFAFAALCLAADLWTKYLVFYPLPQSGASRRHVMTIASWFDIITVYNQGITFGLASGASAWVLGLVTGAVIALLAHMLWSLPRAQRAKSLAISMIVGGALGNLYDRTLRPHLEADRTPGVRDFLDWYAPDHWALGRWLQENVGTTHWYTSNVADVLIVCGVILLAWRILREKPDSGTPAEATP
jgi:signal peptidase II